MNLRTRTSTENTALPLRQRPRRRLLVYPGSLRNSQADQSVPGGTPPSERRRYSSSSVTPVPLRSDSYSTARTRPAFPQVSSIGKPPLAADSRGLLRSSFAALPLSVASPPPLVSPPLAVGRLGSSRTGDQPQQLNYDLIQLLLKRLAFAVANYHKRITTIALVPYSWISKNPGRVVAIPVRREMYPYLRTWSFSSLVSCAQFGGPFHAGRLRSPVREP